MGQGAWSREDSPWGPDDLNSVCGVWCEILGVLAKVISIRRELRACGAGKMREMDWEGVRH